MAIEVALYKKIAYNYGMIDELKKIVEKYYNSELEKYKEDCDESDEECKRSVSEFVVGEIDEILSEIVEKG